MRNRNLPLPQTQEGYIVYLESLQIGVFQVLPLAPNPLEENNAPARWQTDTHIRFSSPLFPWRSFEVLRAPVSRSVFGRLTNPSSSSACRAKHSA